MDWMNSLRRLLLLIAVLTALGWTSRAALHAAAPAALDVPVIVTNCANDTELRTALGTAGAVEITFDCGPGSHTIPVGAFMQVTDVKTVNGANQITLDGGGTAALLQVFATADLALRDITLINGVFNGAHPIENFGRLTLDNVEVREHISANQNGGAIGNTGVLIVRASDFISNSVAPNGNGGAIFNDGGTVEIMGSLFEGNQAGASGDGGAIANHGTMTITDSTLRNNQAFDAGALRVAPGAAVTVTGSTFISNVAGYGGAIEVWGRAVISHSVLRDNVANVGDGGAIWVINNGLLDVHYSTVADNRSTTKGGGLSCDGVGLTVTHSTISGNRVGTSGATRHGGGIYSQCELDLFNSTVVDNEAPFGGGGGVYQTGTATAALVFAATIADNNALFGAGVYNDGAATSALSLKATLLVNNKNGAANGNCDGANITSQGYNLSSDTNCSALTQTGDQQNLTTLALGSLADNGGPTLTRLPLSGNPAIDAIPTALCAFNDDQRGVVRPGQPATNCDVGAVEIGAQRVYIPVALSN
jgi:hypothetical protein